MMDIGRLCIKLSGKESGRKVVVVDVSEGNFVIIDGNVKRRKCNIAHLQPLPQKFEINKGASTEEVRKVLADSGMLIPNEVSIKEKKPRKGGKRPVGIRPRKKVKLKSSLKKSKPSKKTDDEIVEEALSAVDKSKG